MMCLQPKNEKKSIAIRCHSCGDISHRKCDKVSRYAPHEDWCCHVCNHKIPTSNSGPKNLVCPACRGLLVNYRAQLECSECKKGFHLICAPKTRPALEHFQSPHSWTCQTCLSAITVGQPNSRTEQHKSPKTPLKS